MKIKLPPIQPRKPQPLTVKQELFAKRYVANKGNGRKTATEVYNVNTDASARSVSSEVLTNPNVKSRIVEYLRSDDIQNSVNDVLRSGLKAKRCVTIDGGIVESDIPDHSERRKTASLVGDFLGLKSKTLETTTKSIELTASLNDMSEEQLKALLTNDMKTLGVIP